MRETSVSRSSAGPAGAVLASVSSAPLISLACVASTPLIGGSLAGASVGRPTCVRWIFSSVTTDDHTSASQLVAATATTTTGKSAIAHAAT